MVKYNLGDVLQQNQGLGFKAFKILLIILIPTFGMVIDNTISNFINGGSLFANFNLTLFEILGYGVWIYFIYKLIKNRKERKTRKLWKYGLEDVMASSTQFHIKKGENIFGPRVSIEENSTDLFLTLQMPFGLSKEPFKKHKELFENVFYYPVVKINETHDSVILQFKKAEKNISTGYLYEVPNKKVILGYDTHSEPVLWEPLKEPHLLVASATGGGKTVYLQSIVLQLKNITDNLIFVDFKGNEFGPLRNTYKVHTTLNGVLDTLRDFNKGMKDRTEQLIENRLRDYTQLNLEPHYLIFDEYSELISMFDNTKEGKAEKAEFEKLLGSIARLGRSAGYYVILSMQQPNANTLSTEIRDNMMKKVAIKGANNTVQTMIYGERVPDIGALDYGNHIINTGNGYEIIKVPFYEGNFFEDMESNQIKVENKIS